MSQLIKPPEEMTVPQLKRRIAFHLAAVATFEQMREPSMARSFKELVNKYADELDRREPPSCTAGIVPESSIELPNEPSDSVDTAG